MDISKWAFRNRNLIYFLIAVLLLGGAYSCYQMSKLEDPEIKVKLAMVVTTYPGASAHQVELEVTDVLEKNIRTMGNIDNIESYSYNDLSLIQIELLSTVPDDDVEQCWDMLRRKVSDARALLPEGATTPIVKDDFGNVYGMFYALTGDGLSDRELSDYAELVKREVNELEGVDRVELYGKRSECINISLLQDRMANLGVKPAEVLATLNGQNKTTYTGYYENGENRIRVTVNDKFKTVEDIGKMLIQGHDDDQLRLSDIARIEKAYENPTRNEMFYDHERALGILIAASSGSDIIKVGHAVESKLEELKAERLPAGVECHKIFYQPERRQLFGNLCHQPDRIRHHRSTDTDDSNGVQERPYHRYQPGHHRIRFFSVPLFGRRNHAARIIGCFCTGNGNVGRQRHRHHRRHTGRLESRQKPDRSHDRHRKTDSHASSGRDTDSHYRLSTHLHVPRHRRRLHARPFHRTCRFPVAKLDIGTDPCTTDGRPPAASCHRY